MERLRLLRRRISSELIACGFIVVLYGYGMGLSPYVESSNQLSLILIATLAFCIVMSSGSRTAAALAASMLSMSVAAAEITTSIATNDELLLSRCMGSFVGAGIAAFMLRKEYNVWEVIAIFALSFGVGMVCYRPFMDWVDWPQDQPAYHLTGAFVPAAVGMIGVMMVYSKRFRRWIESKFIGGKDAVNSE